MRRLIHESTLAGDTDCCQDVVAGHHDRSYFCLPNLGENSCCGGLQLVFEDDKPNKVQAEFGVLSFHFLRLDPAELRDVFGSAADDSVALVGVVGEKFLVIIGD